MKNRILFVVTGLILSATMGIAGVFPVLPDLATCFDVSAEESGLIIATFALPGFFLIPLLGIFVDRFGRKPVLLISLIVFCCGGIGSFLTSNFQSLLIFRAIQGAGASSFTILYTTIIADTWQGEERVRFVGLSGMILGISTAVSPALGGALGMLGAQYPFLLCLIAIPVFVFSFPISFVTAREQYSFRLYVHEAVASIIKPGTRPLLLLGLLSFLLLSGPLIVCFPLFAKERFSATSLEIGCIMSAASLVSGIIAMKLSKLPIVPRKLLLISQGCYCLAFLLIPLCTSFWQTFLAIIFFGFGQGLSIPLSTVLLASQTEESYRGALMAMYSMVIRLAQGVGPLLFGWIVSLVGASFAISLGSIITFCMIIITLYLYIPVIDYTKSN